MKNDRFFTCLKLIDRKWSELNGTEEITEETTKETRTAMNELETTKEPNPETTKEPNPETTNPGDEIIILLSELTDIMTIHCVLVIPSKHLQQKTSN